MIPILSILIVNYNGKNFLSDCLHSIAQYAECSHEVIVFDNASTDGSLQYLSQHYPQLTVIESGTNVGFARGNNIAAMRARGEILLLLNNDTRLLSSLAPAIEKFNEDEHLGVLGCRMSYVDGRLQPSTGYEHTPLRTVFSWSGLAKIPLLSSVLARVDVNEARYSMNRRNLSWVSGAFLMTRRNLWQRLAGLDERYFMYMEDVDYCKRANMLGYTVSFTPSVTIVHFEGAGKTWIGKKALKDSMKSYIVYFNTYYKDYAAILARAGLSMIMLMRACIYGIISSFSDSSAIKEKRTAYFEAARVLIRGVGRD